MPVVNDMCLTNSLTGESVGDCPTGGGSSGGGGNYEIPTGGSTGGGLATILTNNSNNLISALTSALNGQKQEMSLQTIATQAMNGIQNDIKNEAIKQTEQFLKQSLHYDKKNEHLDYAKNGNLNLKNTDDEIIKPRDEQAKYHSEKRIDEERTNNFNASSMLDNFDKNDDVDIDQNIMSDTIKMFIDSIDVSKIDKGGA